MCQLLPEVNILFPPSKYKEIRIIPEQSFFLFEARKNVKRYQDGGGRENAKICDESVFLHLARKFSKLSLRSTCRGGVQLSCHKASMEVVMPNR